MEYFAKHKLIGLTLLIQLIALPILLVMTREPQSNEGKAAASTAIILTPNTTINSPLKLEKGEYFTSVVIIEPGVNPITEAKIEINYDPAKIELVKDLPVSIETTVFPKILEQPAFVKGKIDFTLATDPLKPITQKTKVATLYFKALDSVNRSYIYFTDSTKLSGIVDSNANILQGSVPQIITVSSPSAEPKTASFSTLRTKTK